MERGGGLRLVGNRGNSSPERGRAAGREVPPAPPMRRVMKVLKKVQVVYYLTRNGQLEHPHFMEVSHLANQQLRLKDFIDRLILLRGRGMPSRYSWSCKRGYKNGYVWNDLTENDIIHTSEGAEYILKGSEILHSSSEFNNKTPTPLLFMADTERLQQLQISEKRTQSIYNPISKVKLNSTLVSGDLHLPKTPIKVEEESYPVGTEDSVLSHKVDDEEVEKRSFTSSNGPSCRCSRRTASSEELQFVNGSARKSSTEHQNPINSVDDHPSPPSSTSTISSEKGEMANNKSREPSRRFMVVEEEEEESVAEMTNQGKSSVLLQLIACGGSVAAKGKSIPCLKQQMSSRAGGRVVVSGGGGLRRGVVCKAAAVAAGKVMVMGEEEVMIKYMSENPRFGNLQSEEKEYFSGSILEAMDDQRRALVQPPLKKSSSYKEERSSNRGLEEASEQTGEEDLKREKAASSACGAKSICIPNPMRKHNKQQSKK